MRQNHHSRRNKKIKKTLRHYNNGGTTGTGTGTGDELPTITPKHPGDELPTTTPKHLISSSSSLMVRGRPQNSMNWLGPFKMPVARHLSANASASAAEISGRPKMTHRQRKFLQNLATRKSFSDALIRNLIGRNRKFMNLAKKRVVSSLLLDTSVPYALDRVIMIGGHKSTPYRWPNSMFLDPDGNIVVGSNTPHSFQYVPADRIQVFRYSDGELLKSMCASTSEIGNMLFHDGFIIFPEGEKISFLNYSNGKKIQQQQPRPDIEIYNGITVAPDGCMLMGFNKPILGGRGGRDHIYYRIVRTDLKSGQEIDSVGVDDTDNDLNLCGLTFDPQGRLVATLCSHEKIEIRVYDYTPFKKPSTNFIKLWKTIIFHRVNRAGMAAFDRNGNLLVTDTTGLVNIMKYPEGSLIQSFECQQAKTKGVMSQCIPYCIIAGHNGDILVCDKKNMCIKIFTQRL